MLVDGPQPRPIHRRSPPARDHFPQSFPINFAGAQEQQFVNVRMPAIRPVSDFDGADAASHAMITLKTHPGAATGGKPTRALQSVQRLLKAHRFVMPDCICHHDHRALPTCNSVRQFNSPPLRNSRRTAWTHPHRCARLKTTEPGGFCLRQVPNLDVSTTMRNRAEAVGNTIIRHQNTGGIL